MTRDATQRILDEIHNVLSSYGIPYEHVVRRRHSAVEFHINGRKVLFTYSAGDWRAPMNARSNLRHLLNRAGATIPAQFTPELLSSRLTPPYDTEVPMPELDAGSDAEEERIETPEPEVTEQIVEPVPPEQAAAPNLPPLPPLPPIAGTYSSERVLAIRLDRDLLASRGNILVIPLRNPGALMEMAPEQFEVLFSQEVHPPQQAGVPPSRKAERRAPEPPPEELEPEEFEPEELEPEEFEPEESETLESDWSETANAILTWLHTRRGAVKTEIIADTLNRSVASVLRDLRDLKDAGAVESGPSGFWRPLKPAFATPKSWHHQDTTRSVEGVPPQLGRMLAAMLFVTNTTGKPDLRGGMLAQCLIPRDLKQFAARMPSGIAKGLVLMTPGSQPAHYALTPKGRDVARRNARWYFERDKMTTPEWAATL